MGMNMLSKGVEAVLTMVKNKWPETMDVISISGNYCTGMILRIFDLI